MGGVEREEQVPDISSTDIKRETQQDPVRVQFEADRGPVPGGDEDREDTAKRLVCLMTGTHIAYHPVVDVLERDQPARWLLRPGVYSPPTIGSISP